MRDETELSVFLASDQVADKELVASCKLTSARRQSP
jgi:hypothetical protein